MAIHKCMVDVSHLSRIFEQMKDWGKWRVELLILDVCVWCQCRLSNCFDEDRLCCVCKHSICKHSPWSTAQKIPCIDCCLSPISICERTDFQLNGKIKLISYEIINVIWGDNKIRVASTQDFFAACVIKQERTHMCSNNRLSIEKPVDIILQICFSLQFAIRWWEMCRKFLTDCLTCFNQVVV